MITHNCFWTVTYGSSQSKAGMAPFQQLVFLSPSQQITLNPGNSVREPSFSSDESPLMKVKVAWLGAVRTFCGTQGLLPLSHQLSLFPPPFLSL